MPRIVLGGLNRLGVRTLEQLRAWGCEVVVIAQSPDAGFARRATELGATIVEGNPADERSLREAGVADADAVLLADDDDVRNLHGLLAASELNPGIRIVARMFNTRLATQVRALVPDARLLGASLLVAPRYVELALGGNESEVEIGGETVRVHATEPLHDAGSWIDRIEHAQPRIAKPASRTLFTRARRSPLGSVLGTIARDRRVRVLLTVMVLVDALTAVLVHAQSGGSWWSSLYQSITAVTTIGFDGLPFQHASHLVQLSMVALMVIDVLALGLLLAIVTDSIVGERIDRERGGAARRMRNHVVVCGVGTIGYRIIEQLVASGVPVAAIDVDSQAGFAGSIRSLGVPLVQADVRQPDVLDRTGVRRARALIAATDDDAANLEVALAARSMRADLRIVLRVFDPDLAERIERVEGAPVCRSVAALAAPVFACAALGLDRAATFNSGGRELMLIERTVVSGDGLDGTTVADLSRAISGDVFSTVEGWQRRDAEDVLCPGDRIVACCAPAAAGVLIMSGQSSSDHAAETALR